MPKSNLLSPSATISVIRPEAFDPGTAQTSGSLRLAAITPEQNIETGLWGGIFIVKPGAKTGIHHHGEQETIVYVLEGSSYVRWGEHGEHEATVHAGEFLHAPRGCRTKKSIHRKKSLSVGSLSAARLHPSL